MKIAAVADLHCTTTQQGYWAPQLETVNTDADVLVLAGDLTFGGELEELRVLLDELEVVRIPIVTVLGNHDYDGGRARVIAETLRRARINNLEGSATEIDGVAFVGGMGVEGGFASGARRRWSYAERQFMTRLEHYLQASANARRVVVLHYAPITATLTGESPKLYPLLGSSAMSTAIDSVGADLILHGHAHYGAPEGRTEGGVPVYNVALPVLHHHGSPALYRIFEV